MSQYQQDVNSINTINWCLSVLKANKDGVTFERAFMARYLLHVVGDIHQPLHDTMMFNGTYKTGDLGGKKDNIQEISSKWSPPMEQT
jgi:S1/P1 Nuclease